MARLIEGPVTPFVMRQAEIKELEQIIEGIPLDERIVYIDAVKSKLSKREQNRLTDFFAIAAARADDVRAIEYIIKTPKGKPIKLGTVQKLMLDFGKEAHAEGLISIIYAPMGCGKTTVMLGKRAVKIGRDISIRLQVVSASDDPAIERCEGIRKIIESKHYQKVFPNVKKGSQWTRHKFTVDRSQVGIDEEEEEDEFDGTGESGAINATCSAYGADSAALGSRSDDTLLDDVPTYENSIQFPSVGEHVYNKIKTKFFSRRESPLGTGQDEHYSRKDDPWRVEFICTPWAEMDPVYRLRNLPTAATIRIGVNSDFTGYNVEIWGLPPEAAARLMARYATGPGEAVDTDLPAQCIFTIPLFRNRKWYLDRFLEDEREFDRMYRCKVYAESERAFPELPKCLVDDLEVEKSRITITRDAKKEEPTGWLVKTINPSPNFSFKLCTVDLSGAGREGTVLLTESLLVPDFTREFVESAVGAWAGNEIIDQMGLVFKRHNDLDLMLVEDAAQQKMFIQLAMANRQKYPWMVKVGFFEGVGQKKSDKQLGVLTMATPIANKGFRFPNVIGTPLHPRFGSPEFPKGCPCGLCRLLRDMRAQLRTAEIKSDDIMALWMNHTSMPMILKNEIPQMTEAGVERVKSGYELMQLKEVSQEWGAKIVTLPETDASQALKHADAEQETAHGPEVYAGKRSRWQSRPRM